MFTSEEVFKTSFEIDFWAIYIKNADPFYSLTLFLLRFFMKCTVSIYLLTLKYLVLTDPKQYSMITEESSHFIKDLELRTKSVFPSNGRTCFNKNIVKVQHESLKNFACVSRQLYLSFFSFKWRLWRFSCVSCFLNMVPKFAK